MSPVDGKRIAIANRGEIAVRIAATCRRMGAIPILLIGEPDVHGYAARQIGRVEIVGVAGSELDVARVVAAAKRVNADCLHPGYGFLSERSDLAEACLNAGLRFVGPSAETLRICGDKLATRAAASRAGAPVLPASPPLDDDPDSWREAARAVGFPLLVKPAGAGGGRGLRHVADDSALVEAILASRREAESTGAGAQIYLERELIEPRHVEVQLAADRERVVVVGDRDCSVQRRHQKVIELAPAPHLSEETRKALHDHARRIAEETRLRGIATCEFLLGTGEEIAFLEVNPRIQVEHPVTELVTGIDLVEWQLVIAADGLLPSAPSDQRGHAIEARIYAEDPWAGFFPTPGRLATVSWPTCPDIRVDAGYESGDQVPPEYDSMIAKVVAHGSGRESAIAALRLALCDSIVSGVATNLPWLVNLLDDHAVQGGQATTRTAAEVAPTMPERSLAPVAAAAYLLDRSAPAAGDAWSAIGPWRTSGKATITLHGDDWEDRVVVSRSATGWEATVGSSAASIRWWRDPMADIWTIASEDVVTRFTVFERDSKLDVTGGGGHWTMRIGPKPVATVARSQRSSDGRVSAPLPATVLGIHVQPGDRVAAGQSLVTLYAMKMELACEAPIAGVVQTVSCQVKDLVAADQLLVTLRGDHAPEHDG